MNSAVDPWVITPRERAKYEEQFKALNPLNEHVTGMQARGFFMQSQLPTHILGEIWALADTDNDGKMNINEFSIACKLINLKLRSFEIPKVLPPALLASLTVISGTPTLTPTGINNMTMIDNLQSNDSAVINTAPAPARPPPMTTTMISSKIVPPPTAAVVPNTVCIPSMVPIASVPSVPVIPPIMSQQPLLSGIGGSVNVAPVSAPAMIPPMMQPLIPGVQPIAPVQPLVSAGAAPPSMAYYQSNQPLAQPVATQPQMTGILDLISIKKTSPVDTVAIASGLQASSTPPQIPGVQPIAPVQSLVSAGAAPPSMAYYQSNQPLAQPVATQSQMTGILDFIRMDTVATASGLPAPPTPPQSGTPSRSMSISEKVPSIDSPGSISGQIEWAIKSQAKLKYTQLFNTTDRTRSGFLTGPQARNIMMQSKLPQKILAQIWALADMDSDGRLGCDEFVLAMYLCDLALQGDPIPNKLPSDLIPPSFRKNVSRHGSISRSRHGSVSSQSGGQLIDPDPAAGLPMQTSFEDKRKENFDKGQAELDRRRKVLLDIQRKEQEERERKEREEAEKREKARLEAERRQQEELERQLQIQRELEQEKEEKRNRELEQKEIARKEMEKQRQLEWEKQRISEMQLQQQREQEKVLKLKAQNQQYSIELSTLKEKIKELSQKICDTRAGVSNVKTVIDGMRSTRDAQMTEMAQSKARIKDQNQKLVQLSQEKVKLDNKHKQSNDSQDQAFSNKQIIINQLTQKVENSKKELEVKQIDVNQNSEQLTELKTQVKDLLEDCERIYSDYDMHRNQVLEMKANRKNEMMTSAWDTAESGWGSSTFDDEPVASATTLPSTIESGMSSGIDDKSTPYGYYKYRAIYEFSARNSDEITFQPGDIVFVPVEQNAEPGWLAGEINGHTGWFPETYVEKLESPTNGSSKLSEIPETVDIEEPVIVPESTAYNGEIEEYIACYPYESNEIGDLVFGAGEHISVIKKDGDWWTGVIGNRTGIFPSNYVAPATAPPSDIYATNNNNNNNHNGSKSVTKTHTDSVMVTMSEEAKRQEEADTEVSEINTQTKSEYVQENYSRPMSTTSTTPGLKNKKGEVAQVIATYEATSPEQLSLQRGQLIMIRKRTESGWWEGELQARGRRKQVGWFPATYVKVLQSGRLSGRSTPVSGGKIQMNEAIIDKVIALFPYKAQNDDELSFEKDDIISVLGKDEPEWWRGECQGLTGLFPSNYVGPFVTLGNV